MTAFDRFIELTQQERVRTAGMIFNLRRIKFTSGDLFILEAGIDLDGIHVEPTALMAGTREAVADFGMRWTEEGLISGHFEWRNP
jgi:hypothetical protein